MLKKNIFWFRNRFLGLAKILSPNFEFFENLEKNELKIMCQHLQHARLYHWDPLTLIELWNQFCAQNYAHFDRFSLIKHQN